MSFLLDINVIIALVDPFHVFHDRAHHWFERESDRGWATCPLTENGAIRIMGHRRYLEGPGSPAQAAGLIRGLRETPHHQFWPDSISLLDSPSVSVEMVLHSAQVTDIYLLALAAHNGGTLATFDRKLSTAAVSGGHRALHVIA